MASKSKFYKTFDVDAWPAVVKDFQERTMSTRKTLVTAIDEENNDAYAFMVTHTADVDAWPAVVKAFKEYAKTAAGKKYIKDNGSNCGDAVFTPKQYLIKHGILSVETVTGDHRVIIHHNDSVLG